MGNGQRSGSREKRQVPVSWDRRQSPVSTGAAAFERERGNRRLESPRGNLPSSKVASTRPVHEAIGSRADRRGVRGTTRACSWQPISAQSNLQPPDSLSPAPGLLPRISSPPRAPLNEIRVSLALRPRSQSELDPQCPGRANTETIRPMLN